MPYADPEKRREFARRYYAVWDVENRDKRCRAARKYYWGHRDLVLEKAREIYTTEDRWVAKLKSAFKITPEDYATLLARQNGACKICLQPASSKLHVDHDHRTGKIRGLLCGPCNRGLGFFRDNQASLNQAIDYLKESETQDDFFWRKTGHERSVH